MKWRVGSIKNRSAHAAHIVRVFLWESKGCGLSPQGYAPWTPLVCAPVGSVPPSPLRGCHNFRREITSVGTPSAVAEDPPRGAGHTGAHLPEATLSRGR